MIPPEDEHGLKYRLHKNCQSLICSRKMQIASLSLIENMVKYGCITRIEKLGTSGVQACDAYGVSTFFCCFERGL